MATLLNLLSLSSFLCVYLAACLEFRERPVFHSSPQPARYSGGAQDIEKQSTAWDPEVDCYDVGYQGGLL